MRQTEIDQQIETIAAKQVGAFSRKQAFDVGASERLVTRRLAEKHWIRVAPAVYVLASSPGTWIRQCKIAELSVDESAIAGHAALVLHEVPGFKPGGVELWTPVNSNVRSPVARIHRYAGATLTTTKGMRVTTVAQALFDVAMVRGPWTMERAIDVSLLEKKVTIDELDERLRFYEGSRRPGLPIMRPLIEERREEGWTPPESELESLLYKILSTLPGAPRVERQAAMPWRRSEPLRVDALLPDHNLIIEADGRRWHTRMKDFDRDQWRTNEAVANGYGVMHFTWVHLHDFPEASARQILRTIGRSTAA
jgi:very-short-patch-repair endonuclease